MGIVENSLEIGKGEKEKKFKEKKDSSPEEDGL
jgi:hypothetical protein